MSLPITFHQRTGAQIASSLNQLFTEQDDRITAVEGAAAFLNSRGFWVSGEIYYNIPGQQRDLVMGPDGTAYVVLQSHTSTSIAADLAAGKIGDIDSIRLRADLAGTGAGQGAEMVAHVAAELADPVTVAAALRQAPLHADDFGGDIGRLLAAAAATGRRAVLSPGATYTLTASVVVVDAPHIDIDFAGAKLVRSASAPNETAMTFAATLGVPVVVSGVSAGTYTFPNYGGTTDVSIIETAVAVDAVVGDVFKIVADDLIWSSPVSKNERVGESFEVGAISGTTIYTRSPLREAYTTNIRLSKMRKDVLRLKNLDLSDELNTGKSAPLLRVRGFVAPSIQDSYIHDSASYGLQLVSCHRPHTKNLIFSRLRTLAASAAFGYGVHEVSCVDSYHENIKGSLCRHVFTTGTISTSENSSLIYYYGANIGAQVVNGLAYDCENSAWDTHSDSLRTTFRNCVVRGTVRGASNSLHAIQLRGRFDMACFCETEGTAAVYVQMSGDNNEIKILGHVHRRSPGVLRDGDCIQISSRDGGTGRVELDVSIEKRNLPAVEVVGATYVYGKIRATQVSGASASTSFIRLWNGASFVGDVDIDMSGSGGSSPRVFTTPGAAFVNVGRLRVRRPGAADWYVADLLDQASEFVVNELNHDSLGVAGTSGFLGFSNAVNSMINDIKIKGVPRSQGVRVLTNASVTLSAFGLQSTMILAEALTATRTITLPGAVNSKTLPVGKRIRFVRTTSSTGGSNLVIDGVGNLATGQSLEVVWTGAAWQQM
jgi:hypothetical protein